MKIADEQERGEFLDRVCGGDTEQRRKLERLLAASETAAVNPVDRLLAWMTVRRRRWAVPAGLFMTLIAVVAVGRILVTGESPLPLYDDQPLATFLQHLMVLCALGITALAYVAALPAAFGRISHTRT